MRLLRRRRRTPLRLEPLADGVPRRGLFSEPLRVEELALEGTEPADEGLRATFVIGLRDAEGRRVPDIAVTAEVTAPGRSVGVEGTTDLMGRLRVRTRGPRGHYGVTIVDVAAGGLAWDAAAGPTRLEVDLDVPDVSA